jgi:multicomponent Na+:H+ antiporter subunit G
MPATLAEAGGIFLLLLGTSFCVLGVYGLLTLRDFYNRLHAAGMVITLGALGIMLSLFFTGSTQIGWKGLATGIFLLLTGPLVSHVLARTAHQQGVRIQGEAARDDLAKDWERGKNEE